MIFANDIEAVEQGLRSAHDAYRAGEKGPNHLRKLNSVFETTSPTITEFANAWREKYPNSPHANIANAYIFYKVGWVLRGEADASKTYHEAMRAFSRMMYKADHFAMLAYDQDRHLLPVTDALLQLTAIGYSQLPHEGLIRTIMKEQPNAGSMFRVMYGAAPGWGGTREYGDRLCNSLAADVPEWGAD